MRRVSLLERISFSRAPRFRKRADREIERNTRTIAHDFSSRFSNGSGAFVAGIYSPRIIRDIESRGGLWFILVILVPRCRDSSRYRICHIFFSRVRFAVPIDNVATTRHPKNSRTFEMIETSRDEIFSTITLRPSMCSVHPRSRNIFQCTYASRQERLERIIFCFFSSILSLTRKIAISVTVRREIGISASQRIVTVLYNQARGDETSRLVIQPTSTVSSVPCVPSRSIGCSL